MFIKISFLFISLNILILSQTKQVAITVDDLPIAFSGNLDSIARLNLFDDILDILEKEGIKVFGFANGRNNSVNEMSLLKVFINRGHTLGNHTYSHFNLSQTNAGEYIIDIQLMEDLIINLMGGKKYFRYSYLRRGNTKEKRDSVYDFLKRNDYTIVPVSIDNDEWIYNSDYIKAFEDREMKKAEKIGEKYIEHMAKMSNHFDSLAFSKTNRHIKHILLIHMNFINANYLDELISWYKNNDWEIISVNEALTDPIYKEEDIYIGERGVSYIKRIK